MKDDKTPAFPARLNPGMTLRDYFAGQIVVGLITLGTLPGEATAKAAYLMADDMMEARKK